DAFIVRDDVLPAAANAKLANYGGLRTLEYFDDLAISAAARFNTCDANHHTVAMHRSFGGFGRNKNIAGDTFNRPFRNEKSIAIAMHVQTANGKFASARGHGEVPGTDLDQIAARG